MNVGFIYTLPKTKVLPREVASGPGSLIRQQSCAHEGLLMVTVTQCSYS